METIKVKSWNDLQDKLFKDSWNKEYKKYISPYVFRGLNDKRHNPNTTLIRLGCGRPDLNSVELALVRNFRKYALLSVPRSDCIWHLLSSAQHHGLPTRLLDWTYSPLVAIHFATADADKFNKDGAIWAVHFKETHKYLPKRRNLWGSDLKIEIRYQMGGDVVKLFKKTLFLNGSSPSLIIERKNEGSSALSILVFFAFSTGEIRD